MSNALKILGIVAWLLAARLPAAGPQEPPRPARFTAAAPSVTVRLSGDGQLVELTAGRFEQAGHVRRQGRFGPGPPPQLPRLRPGEVRGPASGRRGFGARPGNLQGRSAGTSGPPERGCAMVRLANSS